MNERKENTEMKDKKSPHRITEKQVRIELDDLLERSDEAFDPDRRWKLLETARERYNLLRELAKRKAGYSPWITVGFSFGLTAIAIVFLISIWPKSYIFNAPETTFRVLHKFSSTNFRMQRVDLVQGKPTPRTPVFMYFCPSGPKGFDPPPFEAGMTLTTLWMDYKPQGRCYSIDADNRGYVILRDASVDTCPIVPANCHHLNCADRAHDHIVCDGEPMFEQ